MLGVKLSKCWISFVSSFDFYFWDLQPSNLSPFSFSSFSLLSPFLLSFILSSLSHSFISPSLFLPFPFPSHWGLNSVLILSGNSVYQWTRSLLHWNLCISELSVSPFTPLCIWGLMLNEYAFINTVSSWCVNLHFILKCLFSSSTMSESLVILTLLKPVFFWC